MSHVQVMFAFGQVDQSVKRQILDLVRAILQYFRQEWQNIFFSILRNKTMQYYYVAR